MYQIDEVILFGLKRGGRRLGCISYIDRMDIRQTYETKVIASAGGGLSGLYLLPFNDHIIGRVVGNRIVNRGDGL